MDEERTCIRCKGKFVRKDNRRQLCPDCLKKSLTNKTIGRTCVICGAEFQGWKAAKYCPQCKPKPITENNTPKRNRRKMTEKTAICERCNGVYIKTGCRQKVCAECREEATKEKAKANALAHYYQRKEAEPHFARDASRKRREMLKEEQKEYYNQNKEMFAANHRRNYEKNKEKIKEHSKQNYEKNKEKINEMARQKYKKRKLAKNTPEE